MPTLYTVPVVADGVSADRDLDGVYETINTVDSQVSARMQSDPAVGQSRAIFEFMMPAIPANEVITSVALRLNLTTIHVPANLDSMELGFFAAPGDGVIGGDEFDASIPVRSHFVMPAIFKLFALTDRRYDIGLIPGDFQSQVGPDGRVAIVMQMQTFGGDLFVSSRESNINSSDPDKPPDVFRPQLMITTQSVTSGNTFLTVVADSGPVSEDAGPHATSVTVTRSSSDISQPLTVNLTSTDPSEATVPSTVTIPANANSVQVPVTIVDDDLLDGSQSVQFIVTAVQGLNGSGPPIADPYFGGETGILLSGVQRIGGGLTPVGLTTSNVVIQPNGQMVALLSVGAAFGEILPDGSFLSHDIVSWRLTRVNPDGTYDTSFGTNGVVTTTLPDSYETLTSGLTVLEDGRILVFGTNHPPDGLNFYEHHGPRHWFFARYNPDGSLDQTFGNGGILLDTAGSSVSTTARNVIPLPGGKFLALGTLGTAATGGQETDLAVVRYLEDETRDITFGDQGVATWDNPNAVDVQRPMDMAVQADGKIVVVGLGQDNAHTGVVRFTQDGILDADFGTNGFVEFDIGVVLGNPAIDGLGDAVAIQPDGMLVVSARASERDSSHVVIARDLVVVRLTSNGQLDSTFGSSGATCITVDQSGDPFEQGPVDVILQPDGGIVVGGHWVDPARQEQQPALFRLLADGTPDETFGPHGIYHTTWKVPQDQPGAYTNLYSLTTQADGQLVAIVTSLGSAYLLRFGTGRVLPTAISNPLEVSDHETLSVSINRPSINETAGASAAIGIVVRSNVDVNQAQVVAIVSSDPSEAVSATPFVTIPAGSQSASFNINAVNDGILDGNQTITFSAVAAGYQSGSASLIVTDAAGAGAIATGDILVTRPAATPGTYEIAEFSPTGVFVRAIPIPWGTPGSRPASEVLRDLIQDQTSRIYLYNGTNTPFLTSYDPTTTSFAHQNFANWSSSTINGAGGIATFHQFVFVSDSNTASGVPAGIVRFDRRDGSVQRFNTATEYQDLTVGLNGLLYGLNQNHHVDVYDPVTMSLISAFDLAAGDYRGVAVRADGKILSAGADGKLYLFDLNGNQLNAVNSGAASLTDIDIEPGGRVIAGSLAGEVIVTDSNLTAPTKFAATSAETFVAFAIDASFPVPTVHTSPAPFVFFENDPATPFDSGLLVTDDGINLAGATVAFTNGYQEGLDRLEFLNQNGIQGSFDPATGTLTLIGVSSVANYQLALRSVAYRTNSNAPAALRTVSVTVSDGVNSASASRVIQVTPQNDPPAIFPNQAFFVPENSPNTTPVGTVAAFDDDSLVLGGFALVAGNDTGIFTINPATGQITVNDGAQLDFETRRSYALGVTVSDGSLTSSVQMVTVLITDENDNAPVILPNQVLFVSENAPVLTSAGKVLATDVDTVGTLQDFAIVSGNATGIWGIRPDSGELFVLDGSQLDYETKRVYTLGIQVSDGVNLSVMQTVQINLGDQNDVAPAVVPATFTVPENSIANTPVGTVTATDVDTVGTLQNFAIVSGNTASAFRIDSVTGLITINNSVPLNFETTPLFNLGITVSDGLHTSAVQTISVQLTNVNEAPSLSPQTFSIPELSAGGTVIGTVQATDPDAGQSRTYAITSGNAGTVLSIHPQTGVLSVQNGAVLDFETAPVYTFTVTVTDNGSPTLLGSAVITVNLSNVNDAPTITTGQAFTINENSAHGAGVGTVQAQDTDAGQSLAYSITGGNASGAFDINPATGAITVADSSKLDFETTPTFTLTIRVADNGVPALTASASVVIHVANVNEAPAIVPATFTIPENTPKPTFVGTVVATDPDVGQSHVFSIIGGNPDSAFNIHFSLGTLTVNNPAALDFETTSTFSLQVKVQDNGNPSLFSIGTITVNLTDAPDPPIVNHQTFSISESSLSGAAVGTVLATDLDPHPQFPLDFQIIDGDPDGTFALNAQTGVLSIANPVGLDFETHPSLTLQVQVTKPGSPPLSTVATMTVNVSDANEVPVLSDATFNIDENSASTTQVGTISATDPDLGQTLTYSIAGGNTLGVFDINPSSGAIRVAAGAVLNFETTPDYILTVQVADSGLPPRSATAQVTVHLNDLNELPDLSDQAVTIPENAPVGTILVTLAANNPEPGQQLTYSLIAGNANNSFALDPATGQLRVADSGILNFEVVTQIVLTVQVIDDGHPALSDTATFTINLTDENDPPHFAPLPFTLEENSPIGTVVGTIAAVDEDAGQHVTYQVTDSDLDSLFAISQDGIISIVQPGLLDFETHPSIHFTITASDDGHPTASEFHEFTLLLTNVDEPPEIVLAPGVRTLTKPLKKQAVDAQAFIRDVDTPEVDVSNSTVQVNVVESRARSDKARLLKSKRGEVVFKGRNILFQGTVIGERIYGKKGAVPLTIHFNGAATQAAVELVLRKITFIMKGPAGATRVLEFSLTGLNSGQSSHTQKAVQLG